MRYLLFAIGIAAIFTIFTTVFAISAKSNEVRLLPKWLWVVLCLIVPIIGGLLYITIGRPIAKPGFTASGTRVVAPDDDPDFLRNLRDRLAKNDDEDGDQKPKGGDLPNV
jgi:hypothetical protein